MLCYFFFYNFYNFFVSNLILLILTILLIAILIFLFFDVSLNFFFEISIVCFFLILLIFSTFSPYCLSFQHFNEYSFIDNNILTLNLILGVDGFSIYFIVLTGFIMPLSLFLDFRNYTYHFQKKFIISLLLIEFFLILAFTSLDLLIFFVAFESILIPMFLMIGIFGSNKRRVKASYFFLMYSFVFSLFSLFLIVYIFNIAETTNLLLLLDYCFNSNQQIVS